MRYVAAASLAMLLLMPATPRAEDRVVAVDCLCAAEEQGWVRGRGMQTSGEAGLDDIGTGTPESMLVLSAKSDQCAKFAGGCGDERMTPIAGERRMRLDSLSYMLIDDDFRLNLDGVAAPPPGAEPVIPVECLCVMQGTGSVTALSDETPGRLGTRALVQYESVIRLKAEANSCARHADSCDPSFNDALTGELRASYISSWYDPAETGFKLRINAEKVEP